MEEIDGKFWIVWCPTGATPPRHRHESFDLAKAEAERLAECAPRAEFFVMEAVTVSQKVTINTRMFRNEIPF